MEPIQILLIGGGLASALVLIALAFTGPSPAKESTRRLNQVRYRHGDSAIDRVEAQMRKAVAARKPKTQYVAGSGSRAEALALRLHRAGKTWTPRQYVMASVGLFAAVGGLVLAQSGAPLLALVVGLLAGGGIPHLVVNHLIKQRTNAFIARFADAIDLLVRQAFQTRQEADEKWRRVTLTSVQLTSYYSGYEQIMELRERRKQQLGERFNLKEFHDQFLGYGNAPVKMISELMQ
jgi:hypothetical protein